MPQQHQYTKKAVKRQRKLKTRNSHEHPLQSLRIALKRKKIEHLIFNNLIKVPKQHGMMPGSSVVDPYIYIYIYFFFFSDPDPAWALIADPDPAFLNRYDTWNYLICSQGSKELSTQYSSLNFFTGLSKKINCRYCGDNFLILLVYVGKC
jgi:hypothetical protein